MEMKKGLALLTLVAGGILTMAPTRRVEPFGDYIGAYNFRVEIDGVDAGYFNQVSGLEAFTEVIEWQDGDDTIIRKRPGREGISNIVLKKGYIGSTVLSDWFEALRQGNYTRRNMSIILAADADPNDGGNEIKRWNLFECFPARWGTTGLDGNKSEALEEYVEVACEWFEEA
jgi:phage tail-like protein